MTVSSMLSLYHIDDLLNALVDHSLTSVMITKAESDTPIVYVNGAFTDLTGYQPAEVIGKSPKILQGPKTDQKVIDRLRDDLAAGRAFEGQAVNYRNDCSSFDMFWRVFPLKDDDGKPVYFVALQQQATH